ncbi:hypothetical protein AZE42_03618 [Rhizopogon vesiculosus]|uniref:Uncharacterized protein n=1 Tax=Rhizopogon vesiculosus TaxID=180088 RepID=A0A1J8Q1W4_9AGAM|nr:hypothetical protein AZE42_03618 [Rhizopogon vesiculosus]
MKFAAALALAFAFVAGAHAQGGPNSAPNTAPNTIPPIDNTNVDNKALDAVIYSGHFPWIARVPKTRSRKLSDYYTKFDEPPLYKWFSLLDPRISYEGLQVHLDSEKEQLRRYYQDNYLASQAFCVTPQPTTAETFSGSPQKVKFTARCKKRPMNSEDELEEKYRLPLGGL